jgi:hypothetical protein
LWAPDLAPYIMDRRVDLWRNLTLLADIRTQPTATRPLEGFETLTGPRSAIIGHPKLELVTVATPESRMATILTTDRRRCGQELRRGQGRQEGRASPHLRRLRR